MSENIIVGLMGVGILSVVLMGVGLIGVELFVFGHNDVIMPILNNRLIEN